MQPHTRTQPHRRSLQAHRQRHPHPPATRGSRNPWCIAQARTPRTPPTPRMHPTSAMHAPHPRHAPHTRNGTHPMHAPAAAGTCLARGCAARSRSPRGGAYGVGAWHASLGATPAAGGLWRPAALGPRWAIHAAALHTCRLPVPSTHSSQACSSSARSGPLQGPAQPSPAQLKLAPKLPTLNQGPHLLNADLIISAVAL